MLRRKEKKEWIGEEESTKCWDIKEEKGIG